MSKKFKGIVVVCIIIGLSFILSDSFKKNTVSLSNFVIEKFFDTKVYISNFIGEYFNQRDEIRFLREENRRLKESSELSVAFASKLNKFLDESNLKEYNPKIRLVHAIAYANLGDYNKVWIDFPEFNSSKIYGLSYNGYSAGIVVERNEKPLALLQEDPKSTFAVYIGKNKVKGVAFGLKNYIEIRYIPLWSEPKIGDEVITSGLDNIFFEGLKVGKVEEVRKDEGYFTAIVKPYTSIDVPGFFHVIIQD